MAIRKGSLVMIDGTKVKGHPVYNILADRAQWKVRAVINKKTAIVGDNLRLPIVILKSIPQKKGKKVA